MFIFQQSNLKNKTKFIQVLISKKTYTGMSICAKLKCNIFIILCNASIYILFWYKGNFIHRCNYTLSIRYLLTMFLYLFKTKCTTTIKKQCLDTYVGLKLPKKDCHSPSHQSVSYDIFYCSVPLNRSLSIVLIVSCGNLSLSLEEQVYLSVCKKITSELELFLEKIIWSL